MGELVRKWRQYCHILDQEAKGKGEKEKLKIYRLHKEKGRDGIQILCKSICPTMGMDISDISASETKIKLGSVSCMVLIMLERSIKSF